MSADRKGAAVIVGHPGTGIKEQASGLYAKCMAENGFFALAFDAAHQGDSEGEPRNLEDPYQRAEDFKAAVTFLSTLDDGVDPNRIGVIGICASGGYCIFAAQTDVRIRAVATVVGMCWGGMTRDIFQAQGNLHEMLVQSGRSRVAEARGSDPDMVNILDTWDDAENYYKTPRGYHPKCTNLKLTRSAKLLSTHDSVAFVRWISPRPLLMISGSDAATVEFSKTTIQQALEPKELFIIPGKKHMDLYDGTEESIPKLVEFMSHWLCT
ncbi:hypothetical protein NM208_g3745 [Fusarium decemcellulare]|uniref:Uncharacterized protein n=1 Tax=Fusarium decemcellulare TaxID=57161 RepID=A0ACC1SN37_9HYPO|nr:hypothetical protein NM208_g3745 [Fusarium decemcellulare]